MTSDAIAAIADVHGNRWALEAVLKDIEARGITQIINLGDCVYGPLDPGGTADLLNQSSIISIAGNMDVVFASPSPGLQASVTYQFVRHRLSQPQLDWLVGLPATYETDTIFCCHGTPASNDTSLLEDIQPNGVWLASEAQIVAALQGVKQSLVLCAHTHVPRAVWLSDGRLVVNPGSVGMPAYDHDQPYPHKMEAGSPHARYAVVRESEQGWGVAHVAVAYDWTHAAAVARENGREDYWFYLSYGRAGMVRD
jgi:predicted phosphodiesterase